MQFNKKLENDYKFYLEKINPKATREDYQSYLRESNPTAMQESLRLYLQRFFFDVIEIVVSEGGLKVRVRDRGELELGLITCHYTDLPMLYSVSTEEAVKLLSHVWYSYENGFNLAYMSGYWEFPEKLEGSRALRCDSTVPQISSILLRTKVDDLLVTDKGKGKSVYLEKLRFLHERAKSLKHLSYSTYTEFPHSSWVSSLEVLPYQSSSTINTQVCVRPFIEVEVV
mgnify:CR=1 FL=1